MWPSRRDSAPKREDRVLTVEETWRAARSKRVSVQKRGSCLHTRQGRGCLVRVSRRASVSVMARETRQSDTTRESCSSKLKSLGVQPDQRDLACGQEGRVLMFKTDNETCRSNSGRDSSSGKDVRVLSIRRNERSIRSDRVRAPSRLERKRRRLVRTGQECRVVSKE